MKLVKISQKQGEEVINKGAAGYMYGKTAGDVHKKYIVVSFDYDENTFLFENKSEYWEENEGKVKFVPFEELGEEMVKMGDEFMKEVIG